MRSIIYSTHIDRKLLTFLLLIFIIGIDKKGHAQIYQNSFTGNASCPTQGNIPAVATNSVGSPLTRSSLNCSPTSNVFNSTHLSITPNLVPDSYIEFSASTNNSNYFLNITSLSFFMQTSVSAPNHIEVRYSTDGFQTYKTWGSAPLSLTTGLIATWDMTDFSTGICGTVTFRIYPYGTTRSDGTSAPADSNGLFKIDNVIINGSVNSPLLNFCNGIPTAGTVNALPSPICPGKFITLDLTGSSATDGLLYQWQVLTGGTWANIGTSVPLIYTPTIGSISHYRCIVTCSVSGLKDTSNITDSVTTQPFTQGSTCYCSPSSNGNACITNVTLGSNLNNSSVCTGGNNYSFNSTSIPNLIQGIPYLFSMTTNVSAITSVWIDYNHNGDFESSEWKQIFTSGTTGSSLIEVPASSFIGQTRMRVSSNLSGNPNGPSDACIGFGNGETEDYIINVFPAGPYDPGIDSIGLSLPHSCLDSNETLTAYIYNNGSVSINMASSPLIVTFKIKNPVGVCICSCSVVVNSGTIGGFGRWFTSVDLKGINMHSGGNYSINAYVSCPTLSNSVLSNDSLPSAVNIINNRPIVTATNISGCSGDPITLIGSPTGGTFSIPNPYTGSSTNYTYTYTNANGCSATSSLANITIIPCNSIVNLKLFLQGYYNGSNSMVNVLMNQGVNLNSFITDSILVELRNTIGPYEIVASTKTILNSNGTASCTFPALTGSYYIVVKHRNGIQTWSGLPVSMSSHITNYDFTTASSKAYGNNMIQVESNVWAFYSGDINSDENIDLLDVSLLETDINNFQFGYFSTDLNGDGNVDLLDSPSLENNINDFIFSNHP